MSVVEVVPTQKDLFPSKGGLCVGLGFFLLYNGRDFCALTGVQRERMGLGQLLHQPQEMGW